MNSRIAQLLEAHIEHELNRFKEGGYQQTIREEVSAAFNWIRKVKLNDVLPLKTMRGLIQRNVVELPISPGITELAGEMSRRVHASRQNRNTTLEDIFPRKQFDEIIDKVVSLKRTRNNLIHGLLASPVYAKLVADILYTGILEYLLSDNILVQKVPGLSSMIRMSKEAVTHAIPSLEPMIEKQVKQYITHNLDRSIDRSETFLTEFLDQDQILETSEEIWDALAPKRLSKYFKAIDADDMEDFILIGHEFWLHFRKTRYFKIVSKELTDYFYEKYGDKELDFMIEDFGVTEEMVIREVIEIVSPCIEKALSIGYVEERVRARLESFYYSEKVAALIPSPPKRKGATRSRSKKT